MGPARSSARERLVAAATVLFALWLPRDLPAADWGPWDQSAGAGPGRTAPSVAGDRGEPGLVGTVLLGVISFYQQRMPSLVASHCRMVPSCSRYGREAIETHGALAGAVLTFDRLLHEANEGSVSPATITPDGVRVMDPVDNNVAWSAGR